MMKIGRKTRRVVWSALGAAALIIGGALICDRVVAHAAADRMYDNLETIPSREVGLVLGTSPVSQWTGRRNLFFDKRIDAAADLYKRGKVKILIVSGGDYRDTEEGGCDEPVAMRDSLVKKGVPEEAIMLDHGGTRTIHSLTNVKDTFRRDSIIIISQMYHNERALYQAQNLGLDAIAYNAKTPVSGRTLIWLRNRSREVLARTRTILGI